MKKISKLFVFALLTIFASMVNVNAVNISVDDLGTIFDEITDTANYAYIIGNYAFTDDGHRITTKDLMLAARSIVSEDVNGKTDKDEIFNDMRILIARFDGYKDNGITKWIVSNYVGTGDIPETLNLEYVDYIKLTEKQKYTVTYRVDGEAVAAEEIVEGKKVTKPTTDPTKDRFKFLGWYKGTEPYDFNLEVHGNLVLEARFAEIVSIDEMVNLESTELYESNPDDHKLTLEGNVLTYFINNLEDFNEINISAIKDLLGTNAVAKITLSTDSKTTELTSELSDEELTSALNEFVSSLVDERVKNTYEDFVGTVFNVRIDLNDGYINSDDNTYREYQLNINGNVPEKVSVTIKNRLDDSESEESYTVRKGSNLKSLNLTTEITGKTFDGWFTEAGEAFGTETEISENIVLVARYSNIKYNVKFFDGDTEITDLAYTTEYDTTLKALPEYEKEGHDLEGWYLQPEFVVPAVAGETKVTEDINIYGKFTKKTYLAIFYSDNGNPIKRISVLYGDPVDFSEILEPSKSGMVFIGWYSADNVKYDVETPVKGNLELRPRFVDAEYTVKFFDGEEEKASKTVNYNEKVDTKDVTVSKDGYVVEGWYTDVELTEKYDFDTPVTSSLNLYVNWVAEVNTDELMNGFVEGITSEKYSATRENSQITFNMIDSEAKISETSGTGLVAGIRKVLRNSNVKSIVITYNEQDYTLDNPAMVPGGSQSVVAVAINGLLVDITGKSYEDAVQDDLIGKSLTFKINLVDALSQNNNTSEQYNVSFTGTKRHAEVKDLIELKNALANENITKIALIDSIDSDEQLNIVRAVEIDGNGKTIKATGEQSNLFVANASVVLNNITFDGNNIGRVGVIKSGKSVLNNVTITNGLVKDSYISGLYVTNAAEVELNNCNITGNTASVNPDATEYYIVYTKDLWIGANAKVTVNDSTVGNAFVNANKYSVTNPGFLKVNSGSFDNVYLEYDASYGGVFNYVDGTIGKLMVSTTEGNGAYTEPTLVKNTTYVGGQE